MQTEIIEFAPAKINIGLKVLPKEDGQIYHKLESIFQSIDLADKLTVKIQNGFDKCSVLCKEMNLPEENSITSAYKAFKEVSGLEKLHSVKVELEKHIPSGGGLGGGSSDAVALVKALEKLHGIKLSDFQHDKIAEKVGSDVFFFFHCDENNKGCAVVSGRGEIVRDIAFRSDFSVVLVFPKIHSSTKEAYKLLDEYYSSGKDNGTQYPAFKDLEKIYNSSISQWNFVNSFTSPLSKRFHEIENALQCIRQSGALFSDMSGSGSTVYGVFNSMQNSKCAVDFLCSKGYNVAVAE